MADTCPIDDPTNAINKLKMENESVNALIADIRNELLEPCPIIPDMTGGKRRNSKSRLSSKKNKKLMRGGALTARQLTTVVRAFLVLVLGYMSMSSNVAMEGIVNGIVAVYSGQCGTMNNKLWAIFGLGNPVCTAWNRLMTIVGNAFLGDATSIATLSGIAGMTIAIPYGTLGMINIGTYFIATKLPPQLLPESELLILRQDAIGGVKEIETAGARLTTQQQSTLSGLLTKVGLSSTPAITSGNEEMQEGGKRKSQASRKHKTRKSKHSRKGKKIGKSRKSRKY